MQKQEADITIQRIVWDLQVNNLQTASHWQDAAGEYSSHKLGAAIMDAFSHVNDMQQVITIDQLEIDLGNLQETSDLEATLLTALQRAVKQQSTSTQASEFRLAGHHLSEKHLLQQLQYFFEKGYLSWSTREESFSSSEKITKTLLSLDTQSLMQWLSTVIHNEKSFERLLQYFTATQLKTIINRIESASGNIIKEIDDTEWIINVIKTAVPTSAENIVILEKAHHKISFQLLLQPHYNFATADFRSWWSELMTTTNQSHHQELKIITALTDKLNFSQENISNPQPVYSSKIIEAAANFLKQRNQSIEITTSASRSDNEFQKNTIPKVSSVDRIKNHAGLFVSNAGIILLYPYLKHLFKNLQLVNEQGEFKSIHSQTLSLYWLQFIASGETDIPEYQLVLNKILCGYPLEENMIFIPEKKFDEIIANEFLQSVISNWDKIKTTSVEGFRTSFLQRSGKLVEEESNWLLIVERKAWDLLLDTLPYPISIIRLPWMTKPIYVQW